jgi:hypothetical protein
MSKIHQNPALGAARDHQQYKDKIPLEHLEQQSVWEKSLLLFTQAHFT